MNHSVSIFIESARFDSLPDYWKDDIEIIDRDDQYVMGIITYASVGKSEHSCFVGQRINTFTDMWNLWIDRSGNAYYVPWWGHSLTAMLLWSKGVDDLESNGWIHLSDSRIANYHKPKVTDKQYETLALYCEHNHRSMFANIE